MGDGAREDFLEKAGLDVTLRMAWILSKSSIKGLSFRKE